MQKFVLDIPPSQNEAWRHTGKITYLTKKAKEYKEYVHYATLSAQKIAGLVAIDVDIYRPRKRGDVDNRQKLLFDAMQSTVYDNDDQVCDFHVRRFEDKERPRVELFIYEVNEPRPRTGGE
jgi:Holliday junction resolvase RusA-like endonuclease